MLITSYAHCLKYRALSMIESYTGHKDTTLHTHSLFNIKDTSAMQIVGWLSMLCSGLSVSLDWVLLILFSVLTSVMCQDWILFINDFSINKAPESNGRKFYLTSSGASSPSSSFTGSPTAGPDSKNSFKPSTPRSALARVRIWAGGESRNRYTQYKYSIIS